MVIVKSDETVKMKSLGLFLVLQSLASPLLIGICATFLKTLGLDLDAAENLIILSAVVFLLDLVSYFVAYFLSLRKYDLKVKIIDHTKKSRTGMFRDIVIVFFISSFLFYFWNYLLIKVGYPMSEGDIKFSFLTLELAIGGFLVPIVEELVFRGWMMRLFENRGYIVSLTISSLTFGLAHGNIVQSVPCILFGIILGILFDKYGELLPSIIVHSLHNIAGIIIPLIFMDKLMRIPLYLWLIFGSTICLAIIVKVKRAYRSQFEKVKEVFSLMTKSKLYMLFIVIEIISIVSDILKIFNH